MQVPRVQAAHSHPLALNKVLWIPRKCKQLVRLLQRCTVLDSVCLCVYMHVCFVCVHACCVCMHVCVCVLNGFQQYVYLQ